MSKPWDLMSNQEREALMNELYGRGWRRREWINPAWLPPATHNPPPENLIAPNDPRREA